MTTVAELSAVPTQTAFLKPYGYSVASCATGVCTLRVPFDAALERPGGIVSGMTLRGTAGHWVATDMKADFLRSARQEVVCCTERVLKPGKRSMYGMAEGEGAGSGLLAHHVMTYVRVESARAD